MTEQNEEFDTGQGSDIGSDESTFIKFYPSGQLFEESRIKVIIHNYFQSWPLNTEMSVGAWWES